MGDTLVQMADGPQKRIADVQVGDRVKSRDPLTGKGSAKTVTATIQRLAPAVVHLALTDGKTGQSETLTCTPEHPLFVSGRGWVAAGSLGIGTSIVSRAGPLLSVSSLTWEREAAGSATGGSVDGGESKPDVDSKPDTDGKPYTVYNLTVEDDHTYFVGSLGGGTWVHNTCVYRAFTAEGDTEYVGITDNFAQRAAAHLRNADRVIREIPGLGDLTRAEARGVEQSLIDNYGLARNGGILSNQINSIAASNPIYAAATQTGATILRGINFPGF